MSASPAEKQPRGLYLLFGVEMWERFSYYGMRAMLVLFLVSTTGGGWGWTKEQAADVYKWYTGLVYLTPLLGGYLADRVLGTHKAIIIGSFVIAAGHFLLAAPGHTTFFLGLALIVIGTGFHKSNISTMVGQLFRPGDGRRDGAFTIFYVGINVGATLGPLICGWLEKDRRFGWHWAFAAAGVGMVLGTVIYLAFKRKVLGDVGDRPAGRPALDREIKSKPLTAEQKQGIVPIVILALFNLFFWAAYEQTGSSMSFFAEDHTRRMLMGIEIPAPWFQSINPVIIITCAPFFAKLWTWLAARGREPSTPVKFTIALVLLGLGFVLMVMAGRLADGGLKVSPLWLTFAYVLHTSGEICLYPVSLSMVTKLAPPKYGSLLMGFWFFSMAFSDFLAGHIASLAGKIEKGQYFHILGGQADFYLLFVVSSLMAALLLVTVTPMLKKLMHGRA
jgi:POT family proton-dependent oligopeptide transporter